MVNFYVDDFKSFCRTMIAIHWMIKNGLILLKQPKTNDAKCSVGKRLTIFRFFKPLEYIMCISSITFAITHHDVHERQFSDNTEYKIITIGFT